MSQMVLSEARLLTSNGLWDRGWILIDGKKIAQMGPGQAPHFESAQIINGRGKTGLPGFIDLHVHGAVGYDTMDATPEALAQMAQFYAGCGVTGFLATTMTAQGHAIEAALANVAACAGPIEGGATLLGAHVEGPYINAKMKGAQSAQHIRLADPREYKRWLEFGCIRQVTVAPEFPENLEFIEACQATEINVSIGHTLAGYDDLQRAVALGARQTTHTFNAMTSVHHRNIGTAGAALSLDEITCELIADNIHVHPTILKLAVRAKGIERIVLVTDAIRGAGLADGLYELGGQAVTVKNGMATLADGTLAGSVLTMDRALSNILAATSLPLADAWPMTSLNAAKQIGLANRKGRLATGYDADVVLLDEANTVWLTIAEGQIVYQTQGG